MNKKRYTYCLIHNIWLRRRCGCHDGNRCRLWRLATARCGPTAKHKKRNMLGYSLSDWIAWLSWLIVEKLSHHRQILPCVARLFLPGGRDLWLCLLCRRHIFLWTYTLPLRRHLLIYPVVLRQHYLLCVHDFWITIDEYLKIIHRNSENDEWCMTWSVVVFWAGGTAPLGELIPLCPSIMRVWLQTPF